MTGALIGTIDEEVSYDTLTVLGDGNDTVSDDALNRHLWITNSGE